MEKHFDLEEELNTVELRILNLEERNCELEKNSLVKKYRDKKTLLDYFNRIKQDKTKKLNVSIIDIMIEIDDLMLNDIVREYINNCEDLNLCKQVQEIFLREFLSKSEKVKVKR